MTNNKSPFKKSLQPWFLFSHKTRKYICLWTTIPCCCITTPLPWESIEPCLKPSVTVNMSSQQWCKMHCSHTSPLPSLTIIIVEILNDKKYLNSKLLHYRSENYKTTLMQLYSLRTFQWYQECDPNSPRTCTPIPQEI